MHIRPTVHRVTDASKFTANLARVVDMNTTELVTSVLFTGGIRANAISAIAFPSGMPAGASGILELAITFTAFIMQRITDSILLKLAVRAAMAVYLAYHAFALLPNFHSSVPADAFVSALIPIFWAILPRLLYLVADLFFSIGFVKLVLAIQQSVSIIHDPSGGRPSFLKRMRSAKVMSNLVCKSEPCL